MQLTGRKALVTGSASGIGRATAERLGREGCDVCVNYYAPDEADSAAEVVAAVESAGHRGIAVQADVSNEEDVVRLVETAVRELGGLDLLVNNAGIEKQVPLLEMSVDDWNRVLATNLTGAFLCMREAGRQMVQSGGGTVVNISSVHEFIPWSGFAHYCASKGGMLMLMKTAAREWATKNIRVVNVAPGAIATPINAFVLDDPAAKRMIEGEIPLGRFGQADEIAAAVAWLASTDAQYVTGTTLIVDGGISLYPKFV